MSEIVDCVVIGAGVVGIAMARALAQSGREVIVVERNPAIGEETSSRNSEVIHAGLYYPANSLKARLCVRGREMLYAYCAERQVPHVRCGKLIVSMEAGQQSRLDAIAASALNNGVTDLVAVPAGQLARYEPAVRGSAGLWSPSTGIVDSHGLMLALAGDLEAAGGAILTRTPVIDLQLEPKAVRLELNSDGESTTISARTVVNAAGLGAVALASRCAGTGDYRPPAMHMAKGNYFGYTGTSPFRTLVYPLPVDGGLGIHATHDLAGTLRFGPDVEWIEAIDYRVAEDRRAAFAEAIRTYWPDLDERSLAPAYAGIRPKLSGPGGAVADFRIDLPAANPERQIVHLLGIESPGLTACLALAHEVMIRLEAAANAASD